MKMWSSSKKPEPEDITIGLISKLIQESNLTARIIQTGSYILTGSSKGVEGVVFQYEGNFYLATNEGFVIACNELGKESHPSKVTKEEKIIRAKIFTGKIVYKK